MQKLLIILVLSVGLFSCVTISKDRALYNEGLENMKNGNLEKAAELYRQAIALNPRHAFAANNLGVVYAKLKKYDLAIEAFANAVKINSGYSNARYNLVSLRITMKQYDRAMEDARKLHGKDGADILRKLFPLMEETGLSYKNGPKIKNSDEIKPQLPASIKIGWTDYIHKNITVNTTIGTDGKSLSAKSGSTMAAFLKNDFLLSAFSLTDKAVFEPALLENGSPVEAPVTLDFHFLPEESYVSLTSDGLYTQTLKMIFEMENDKRDKCYFLLQKKKFDSSADMNFTISISASGKVENIKTTFSDAGEKAFESCIIESIRQISFPSSRKETFPYTFESDISYRPDMD